MAITWNSLRVPARGEATAAGGGSARRGWSPTPAMVQVGLVLGLALAAGGAYLGSPGLRAETAAAASVLLSGDVDAAREYLLSYGPWAPVISSLLILAQALVSPLPAFMIVFANGLAFGTFWGGLLSAVATTVASGVCFLLARVVGRRPVELMVGRGPLEGADNWFARRGGRAVLAARLVPFMSVDLISFAAGLTGMRLRPFLGATFVGILPSTYLYSYLGERASRYALALLGANVVLTGCVAAAAALHRRRGRHRGQGSEPNRAPAQQSR